MIQTIRFDYKLEHQLRFTGNPFGIEYLFCLHLQLVITLQIAAVLDQPFTTMQDSDSDETRGTTCKKMHAISAQDTHITNITVTVEVKMRDPVAVLPQFFVLAVHGLPMPVAITASKAVVEFFRFLHIMDAPLRLAAILLLVPKSSAPLGLGLHLVPSTASAGATSPATKTTPEADVVALVAGRGHLRHRRRGLPRPRRTGAAATVGAVAKTGASLPRAPAANAARRRLRRFMAGGRWRKGWSGQRRTGEAEATENERGSATAREPARPHPRARGCLLTFVDGDEKRFCGW